MDFFRIAADLTPLLFLDLRHPKGPPVFDIKHFMPISLANWSHKILSKLLDSVFKMLCLIWLALVSLHSFLDIIRDAAAKAAKTFTY